MSHKKMPSNPGLPDKQKGEWAESSFLSHALALDLIVSKPWGDSAPYDFVIENKHGFRRVQVKSAWSLDKRSHSYRVAVGQQGRCYSPRRVDLIAACVVPSQVWYFIPVRKLGRRKYIALFPDNLQSKSRYQPYRELWRMLTCRILPA